MHPNVHSNITYNSQDMEALSIYRRMIKRMWYIHTMEQYSTIKKEGNNAICGNMDGPRGH